MDISLFNNLLYELAKKFNLDFHGIKGINDDSIFKYQSLYDVIKKRNY